LVIKGKTLKGEIKMSNSIKEIIFKFIFSFLFISGLGYFIKWLNLGIARALALAVGISIGDLVIYMFKKYKKKQC